MLDLNQKIIKYIIQIQSINKSYFIQNNLTYKVSFSIERKKSEMQTTTRHKKDIKKKK